MRNVYLVQAGIDHGHETGSWIPFSVGCLWSYASQFDYVKENFNLKEIFFKREKHSDVLQRITEPAVVGFSCYVWNSNYSLELAKAIKNRWPKCVIVVGGPNANGAWTKHDFIDSIVIGEGENPFVKILKSILEDKPVDLFYNEKLTNLDYPSPYITGVFDSIIKDNPNIDWWMVMESTRGCPYGCTFCDWGGAGVGTKVKKYTLERIKQEINWAIENKVAILLMPDANFGIFKDRDVEIAKLLREAADDPRSKIQQIQTTYAKNTNDTCFEIEKILGPYSYGLTVSVQSMSSGTLDAVKRSIMKMNDLEYVFSLARKHNVRTYTELILGLPNETKEEFKNGITRLLDLGQHDQIQVWLATIIPNAEMGSPEYIRRYGIKTKRVKVYKDNCYEGSCEETEFVTETNTMSFDDLVESYMYAWMILNFHHTGYSELLSKYCRNVKGISYREFYDTLFNYIPNDPIVGPIFNNYKETVVEYLTHGDSEKNKSAYLVSLDCEVEKHYKQKENFIEASIIAVNHLLTEDIINLQRIYNVDKKYTYPMTLSANINIKTWVEELTNYSITLPEKPEGSNESFYDLSSQKHYIKHQFKIK